MVDFVGTLEHHSRKVADDWNIIDWRAGDLSKLDAGVRFSAEAGTDIITDWEKTLTDQTYTGDTPQSRVPLLRVRVPTGTAPGGSTRLGMPIIGSECYNGEMKVLLLDRNPAGAGTYQSGIFMRQSLTPSGVDIGKSRQYVAWHDVIFAVESIVNIDYWRTVSTNSMVQGIGEGSGGGGPDLPGLRKYINVNFGSKIGTTVTLNVDANHGVIVGDNIQVVTPEVDDYTVIVTAVGSKTVQYTSGTTAANPVFNSGAGYLMSRSIMPYFLHARLIDNTFWVKAWRYDAPEPDWDSPTHASRMVNNSVLGPPSDGTPGRMGLYAGHMLANSGYVDFGSVWWRSLD
jgi:hypothetical protein